MKIITSKDNVNIVKFYKSNKSKKYRDEENVFSIEGTKLYNEAVASGVDIEFVLISETFMESMSYDKVRDRLKGKEVYIIKENVEKKVSDTQNPQGIYALCRRVAKDEKNFFCKTVSKKLYFILHDIQDPGNVGTIIRMCEGLGVEGVAVYNKSCDIYSPKVIRSSMGSIFRLNMIEYDNFQEIKEKFALSSIELYATGIGKGCQNVKEFSPKSSIGVVLGNEGKGLPVDIIESCKEVLSIPMSDRIESLNVGVAATILAWELQSKI